MAPSIWRRPGTRTFQLVHRSQRDPLINDPNASDRVLKSIDKGQKQRGDRDGASSYAASEVGEQYDDEFDAAAAAGDAAAYGILFEDAGEYDYMQHLRTVGGGGETYLVEAPVQSKQGKGKGKATDGFQLNEAAARREAFTMPEDALPSHPLDEVSYTAATTSRAEETGLRPDLDPSIRQVLEALDDDAYAADDGTGTDDEDAFWEGVMAGGEVDDLDEQEWSDEEGDEVEGAVRGVKKLAIDGEEEEEEEEGAWAAVKRFKAAQAAAGGASEDEDDFASEGGDTIADLKAASARRPARRRAPSAVGSAFSMSSSAMFRNDQLRHLDDRFDQIEKLYNEESDDSWGGSDEEVDSEDDEELAAKHANQREDLDKIMDDFLSRYEVIGGKFRPVLDPLHADATEGGEVSANNSKLDRIRAELANLDLGEEVEGEDPELTARRREKERILAIVERQWNEETSKKKKDRMPMIHIIEDKQEQNRWDCETVLSTYSNLSNHPRMLRLRDSMGKKKAATPAAQIKIDPKTGFPTVDGKNVLDERPNAKKGEDVIMEEEEEDEDEEDYEFRETIKRPRDESAAEKKARKAAVKAERASRRVEKKSTKDTFNDEVKRQKRVHGRRIAEGGAADIRSGQNGVKRLA
ncbi:hypothetical protein JCM8547_002659 [Rhodosporidiobolus lusitaniae]